MLLYLPIIYLFIQNFENIIPIFFHVVCAKLLECYMPHTTPVLMYGVKLGLTANYR